MRDTELLEYLADLAPYSLPIERQEQPGMFTATVGGIGGQAFWTSGGYGPSVASRKYDRISVTGPEGSALVLLCGLHELGHAWNPDLDYEYDATPEQALECEAAAWEWALDHCDAAGIEVKPHVYWIRECFESYSISVPYPGPRARHLTERLEAYRWS